MINRLFSTLLVIVVSAIASQSSNAQTFTVPIAQADGMRASLTVEAQSLSLNLETRAEIPFSDFSIGASVGTSGLSFLIIEDEYIYRSMKVDEDGDFSTAQQREQLDQAKKAAAHRRRSQTIRTSRLVVTEMLAQISLAMMD